MSTEKSPNILPLNLNEEEAEVAFEKLQARLVPLWESIGKLDRYQREEQTIVVVPSQTIDFDCHGAEMQGYEERMLYLLLLLRQPRARLIYVTSQTILESTLDYYLSIMPGIVTRHARSRFFNVAPEDRSTRPLTTKLLERPKLLKSIRALIPDPDRAYLLTYTVTLKERDLALGLGLPLFGSDPSLFYLGSKTGSRETFERAGVSYPRGTGNLHSLEEVTAALRGMCEDGSEVKNAMVKLNDSISGEGNAVVDVESLPSCDSPEFAAALDQRIRCAQFESQAIEFDGFFEEMRKVGGIVEQRILGEEIRSPSVQMRVTPLGVVEILSTHDQLLGGPSGQSFLGSCFPADPEYGPLIAEQAWKIGEELADLGALGRFAVDFVVVRSADDSWKSYAIEINLRLGGTTHPFEILQFLTDGEFVANEGLFRAPSGKSKFYVASDHLEAVEYRLLSPEDLIDISIRHGLHFDQAKQTGVLLHLMATVAENGRFGMVAVGDSHEEAQALYDHFQKVVLEDIANTRQ